MRTRDEIGEIEATLRVHADPERARQEKRYLKSREEFIGVTVPVIRRVAKDWLRAHPELHRGDLLRLAQALWRRSVHELRVSAVELLRARKGILQPEDMELLEMMIRTSDTWAYVDALADDVVGPLVERHPQLGGVLDRWAEDGDFWIRRSALLALLGPLRRGVGDWDRFVRYADRMLDEREFFIRKAIGWVAREASKKRPDRVKDFLAARIRRVSGVTLREAIKYLPDPDRRELLRARLGR